MMSTLQRTSTIGGRITVAEGGAVLIESITAKGRKRATIQSYESHIRVHLAPFFGAKRPDRIGKTTCNALGSYTGSSSWRDARSGCLPTPCSLVDKPRSAESDPDIHFLDFEEVEALQRAVPDDDLGGVERPMYLAAAVTGMRQGELLALRWRDIDWTARRVRVRRNFSAWRE